MDCKVLQLGKFHPIKGGVEKVMYAFVTGLSDRGIRCDMLCTSVDEQCGDLVLNDLAKVIKCKTHAKVAATTLSTSLITKLRSICHEYDIIHIHHPDPMATLALMMSGYKGKVILHWHSDILKQKILLQFFKPLQSWLINRSDLILGTSPIYVQESEALRNVQYKTTYLPIGVRERVYTEEGVNAMRNRFPGKFIIYSMGRLVEYKGYEYLIEAAKELSDEYVVLIGGDGPLKKDLRKQIASLGLEDKVHVLGYISNEDHANYYAAADVFCLPSIIKTEAYAIVQVEAMSVGRPVVATNIPGSGVSWVNAHGESGLNVPIRDSKALANAISTICETPDLYERYARGAKRRFETTFTKDAMIDELIKLYQKVLYEPNYSDKRMGTYAQEML